MNLTDLTLYAELFAAAAIFVSLIFVGYEVHMTRKQAELSNWRDVLQSFVDYKAATNDLDFAAFLVRAHEDYDALTPAEKMSFGLFLEQGVHVLGNFLKHNDSLPRKLVGLEDAIQATFVDMLTTPGGAAWWAEAQTRGRFMPDTFKVVDKLLADAERRAQSEN